MWSVCCCSSFHAVVAPPPLQHHTRTLLFNKRTSSSTKLNNLSSCHHPLHSSLKDDSSSSTPKQSQVGYDAAEELYGLDVDIPPRDAKSDSSEPRSWFGPNGQYIRELPCPNCRGRGYTPCVECGIERSRTDCSLCSGKGIMTCHRCSGECVIWEESIDEIPWEKARSSSPLKVKDDDEVDNLDLKLDVRKKSKRVYRSTPEVGLKISRSLKSLNAKTGLFSKRMKIIHKDPTLHAQRVAAIKKTKRTAAARKQASEALKTFFSNPENRRRRSISMKGTKFFCKKCGKEGHRSHLCPEHGENIDRRLKCGLCGERGHNRKTCGRPSKPKRRILQQYHCGACRQVGHNRRTCSVKAESQSVDAVTKDGSSLDTFSSHVKADEDSVDDDTKHGNSSDESTSPRTHYPYHCRACGQIGHNRRTCSVKPESEPQSVNALTKNGNFSDESSSLMKPERNSAGAFTENGTPFTDSLTKVRQPYRCRRCEQLGHNARTCPQKSAEQANVILGKRARRRPYHCRNCGLIGHNHRTCHVANPKPLNSEC